MDLNVSVITLVITSTTTPNDIYVMNLADSAYKGPFVSDVTRRVGIKPGERRQNEAALLAI